MATFKKGDVVKTKGIVHKCPVESMRMDEDVNVQYLISWTDADEVTQSSWFDEDQLTVS